MASSVSAADWSAYLLEKYFGLDAGKQPVTFSIDRDELAEISNLEPREAVESLAAAVRDQVMPGFRFRRVRDEMERWLESEVKGDSRGNPPPALPLLALNVLVASEMSSQGGRGAPAFYEPLRTHLDPLDEGAGAPGDYSDAVPDCWEMLKLWLDTVLDGERGYSTITRHKHFVNIGYATQQAVLRTVDRRRLGRFFRAISLDPNEEDIIGAELRQALAYWSKRQGGKGERLHRLATDSSLRRYAEDLLEIIAARWDGTIRNELTGAPAAPLRLWIQQKPFSLGLTALWSERLPRLALLDATAWDGGEILIEAGETGAYTPIPFDFEVDESVLDEGLSFESEELALYLEPADAYAFRRDEAVYPSWLSTSRIHFGDPHLLLIREEFRVEMESWLQNVNAEGKLALRASDSLPKGWVLFHGLRIDGRPIHAPPPAVADLLQSGGGTRLKLVGGLKVSGVVRAYFVGGAPMLAIPADSAREFKMELIGDGVEKFISQGGDYPLGVLPLPEGEYRVRHERGELTFDIVGRISERPGANVGHTFQEAGPDRRVSGLLTGLEQGRLPFGAPTRHAIGEVAIGRRGEVAPILLPLWLGGPIDEAYWGEADVWLTEQPSWLITRDAAGKAMIEPLVPRPPVTNEAGKRGFALLNHAPLSPRASDEDQALINLYRAAAND